MLRIETPFRTSEGTEGGMIYRFLFRSFWREREKKLCYII